MTSNGEPYGPIRYSEIVKERYYIAKQAHISYEESGKMTPTERNMVLKFILEDLQQQQALINQQLQKK